MAVRQSHSVLFVCLGNICRSPMAEAILKQQLLDRGLSERWEVDSAALGPWHVGEPPDRRTLVTLKSHGLRTTHRGRVVEEKDFHRFDYILCMDDSNMSELTDLQPSRSHAQLKLLGSYDRQRAEETISDPYYCDIQEFEQLFKEIWQACSYFLDAVVSSS